VVWLQEEPENICAWAFVHGRLHRLLAMTSPSATEPQSKAVSRQTGSTAMHQLDTKDLLAPPWIPF